MAEKKGASMLLVGGSRVMEEQVIELEFCKNTTYRGFYIEKYKILENKGNYRFV